MRLIGGPGGAALCPISTSRAAPNLTLGGLLKHLAIVEEVWFSNRLLGHDYGPPWNEVDWDADPDWEWHSAAHNGHADLLRESVDGATGE